MISVKRVQQLVYDIRQAADEYIDYEKAHTWQDRLYIEVLRSIAEGAPNAKELAEEALKVEKIKFPRYCA